MITIWCGKMPQPEKNQDNPIIHPNKLMINLGACIAFVILLCLSANHFVYAQSQSDETISQPFHIYLPVLSKGNAFFVSTSGNDKNPGSLSSPWRTIGKAASVAGPGDVVYIRGGVYRERVYFTTSGTEANPVQFNAYTNENPIVDGENSIPEQGGYLLTIDGDFVTLSGLEIRNSAYGGIIVRGNYDLVSNMYVHHNLYVGILVTQGHNSTVEKSRIWWNSTMNIYGSGRSNGFGISAARNGVSFTTIRNNSVWENWGEGLSTFEADHSIIEDNVVHDNYSANIYISDATNVLCQRNFVYMKQGSAVFSYGDNVGIMMGDEVYNPPSANITIINNISFGNHGNFWWWQGHEGGGMNNVLIANNTFVNGTGDVSNGEGGVIISKGDHQNVRFENNLIQQDGNLPVIATHEQPGITYSHNLWSKTPNSAATGLGDVIGNPLFINSGDPYNPEWYKLTGYSPAVNQALPLQQVFVDYFGVNREAWPDIGASEFFPGQ